MRETERQEVRERETDGEREREREYAAHYILTESWQVRLKTEYSTSAEWSLQP